VHVQVRGRGVGAGEVVAAQRLGIFGGAFNPPHIGHLILAQEAHAQLDLDRVVLVPTARPPHRQIEDDPGAETRAEMCELAAQGDERLAVSRLELQREGPSYTADTLAELKRESPDAELFLLLGGDQAAALGAWHEPQAVLDRATVAVAERDEFRREDICDRLAAFGGRDVLTFFAMPGVDVSSTMVRRRARDGDPIRYLVPDAVASYIERHGLYKAASAVGAG
jgi:nicotinate-nucleotide adenylyltransferase